MIHTISEQHCHELLATTTVGRIGFLRAERIHIFPLNYVAVEGLIYLRTLPDSILSAIAREEQVVAFEVDHHNDISGTAWSVLMHGPLTVITEDDVPDAARRVRAWAGDERTLPLRFTIDDIAGRSVHRKRH